MENKSKKNGSICMIFGGLLVFGNYMLKFEVQKDNANHIIIMVCAAVIVAIGVVSLTNIAKKQNPNS
ncbi:hypothetical protein IVB69_04795 [Flavobacterium sp. J49]|uniref:hypothetical protein n=1 Tax=Flavobacterium sp. J49 TaxID=2718534 RepID=UPI001593DC6D|nr:hypothetical protein [Flavobacterium sp. J49]MBF6640786.1 hypothetical protein [Flavobacterium sp. J49]NIC02033.1 hypothetical protein [Flavobacterium sp. J49]